MELTKSEKIYQDYNIHQFELMLDTHKKLSEKGMDVSFSDFLRFKLILSVGEISTSIDEITRRHFEL